MSGLIYNQEAKIAWLAKKSISSLAIWIEDFLRRGVTDRLSIQRHESRDLILVHYFNNTENALFKYRFKKAITKLIREITLIDDNLQFYNDLITIAGLTKCVEAKPTLDQIAFGKRLEGEECNEEELHEKTLAVLFGFREKTLHTTAIIKRDIEFPQYCQLCFRGCLDLLGVDMVLKYLPKLLASSYKKSNYPIFPTLELLIDHMGLADFAERFLNICSSLPESEKDTLVENLFYAGMNIRLVDESEDQEDVYFEFLWKEQIQVLRENREKVYRILRRKILILIEEKELESPFLIKEDIDEFVETFEGSEAI